MKTDNSKEGIGYLFPYLIKKKDIYGFVFKGVWYDIGSKEDYKEVNKGFES
jgi:NDP-sugar pyrophosphorylase family protein